MPKLRSTTKPPRPRAIQACYRCRSKKYKCDGCVPCLHCKKQAKECVFQGASAAASGGGNGSYSISYIRELERKLERAEGELRGMRGGVAPGEMLLADEGGPPSRGEGEQVEEMMGLQNKSPTQDGRSEEQEIINDTRNSELMDINNTTARFEFHGQTSHLALLGRLQKSKSSTPTPQIVSDFQNDFFTRDRQRSRVANQEFVDDDFYPEDALGFIQNYFATLHVVHPIIDESIFMERSQRLWNGDSPQPTQAFKALYFAVLSLGALTKNWAEGEMNGIGRYEWTRLLFEKAEGLLGIPGSLNNLEAVQTQFLLAVVCQYLLSSNLAYTYVGLAIRTALSVGMNRNVSFRDPTFPSDSPSLVVSRVWWALYSLEMELSFTLGRPDTLGLDAYHNRLPPPMSNTEISIIPGMLGLSRIMRDISTSIFLHQGSLCRKLKLAENISRDLDDWVLSLPAPFHSISSAALPSQTGSLKEHSWLKLQKLVLRIRYLHTKTILYYPFLLHTQTQAPSTSNSPLHPATQTCTTTACSLIQTIHSTYYIYPFYRTWWHNVTYITFGLCILLSSIAQLPFAERAGSGYTVHAHQALELLGAMAECEIAGRIGIFAGEFLGGLVGRGERSGMGGQGGGTGGGDGGEGDELLGAVGQDFTAGSFLTDWVGQLGYDMVFNFDAGLFGQFEGDGFGGF